MMMPFLHGPRVGIGETDGRGIDTGQNGPLRAHPRRGRRDRKHEKLCEDYLPEPLNT